MSSTEPAGLRPTLSAAQAAAHPDGATHPGSEFDPRAWDTLAGSAAAEPQRGLAWRRHALVLPVLLAAALLYLIVEALAGARIWDAQWRADAHGRLELVASADPALASHIGQAVQSVVVPGSPPLAIDATLLQRSPRWIVDDGGRERHARMHRALVRAQGSGIAAIEFVDGQRVQPRMAVRGVVRLGTMFWLMSALAFVLFMVGAAVAMARPTLNAALYALMAFAQCGNLLYIAAESVPGLGLAPGLLGSEALARSGFDLVTAAAMVHATALRPRTLAHHRSTAALAWGTVLLLLGWSLRGPAHVWWYTQAVQVLLGLAAIAQLGLSVRTTPHPMAVFLRRFTIVAVATLVLLTLAVAAAERPAAAPHPVAAAGTVAWAVFIATLLLALPFLSRSQHLVREFALLAGVTTVATALDLLFVVVFSLAPFASLTLTMFVSLGVYVAIRQWILNQLVGTSMLTTERMFERLYRIARDVQAHPERAADSVARLLRELFEPLEVVHSERTTARTRVLGNGAALLVPVPTLPGGDGPTPASAVVLRYAHRGKRLFASEDARLTDRVLDQLRRAVAYDRAVELGRAEERSRIAQDLHDDIGARLLTLMYQAPTPEVEDYVRHTLKDLKTLTRGLAAPPHRLSHAAAEWKSDISQRLALAQCGFGWAFTTDRDIVLSVVQWSALTRVLRELVSNAIVHAHASRVEVDATYYAGKLTLSVSDNGRGGDPAQWAAGLGLGGVRKRVKQLGGSVSWRTNPAGGVRCEVVVPRLEPRD